MNTHADKTQKNESQSVANVVSQKKSGGKSTFQFVDNRPEAVAQRKLQELVNNNTDVPSTIKKETFLNSNESDIEPRQAVNTTCFIDNRPKSILQKKQISKQLTNVKSNQIIQRNKFSHTLPVADEALSATEGVDRVGLAGNMKRVAAVTGPSGERYVTARGNAGAPAESLTKEAENLKMLRDAGLQVPKVYKKNATPVENISGVISENVAEPFIIMEFVPGQFADVWKTPGSLGSAIMAYFASVQDVAKAQRAVLVKAGIQTILDFLKNYLVVDLQLIIESDTGRVVIIDPAAIYLTTNDEKMEEHEDSYIKTLAVLNTAKTQLDAIIAPPVVAAGPPTTKEGLEGLYESLAFDPATFRARIKNMLEEAHKEAGDAEVEEYVKISECI